MVERDEGEGSRAPHLTRSDRANPDPMGARRGAGKRAPLAVPSFIIKIKSLSRF